MRVPLVSLISREMPMTAGIWLLLLCMNSLKARSVYVGTSVYVLQELRCGRDAAVGISLVGKSHKNCSTFSPADRTEKRSTMPDSPADVKTQSRLTPPTMPPPPTTQGAPRTSSFTPTACEYIKRCFLYCLWLKVHCSHHASKMFRAAERTTGMACYQSHACHGRPAPCQRNWAAARCQRQ